MGNAIIHRFALHNNGYAIPYRKGERNFCPGCAGQQWIIGRLTAECAFCATALPMEAVHGYGAVQRFSSSSASQKPAIAA